MFLRLCDFGTVDAVGDQLAEELEADFAVDVHVNFVGLVDEVDVSAFFGVTDVNVLAQFDVAFGA